LAINNLNKDKNDLKKLIKLSKTKDIIGVRELYNSLNNVDFSNLLSNMAIHDVMFCLRLLKDHDFAEVFVNFSIEIKSDIINHLTTKEINTLSDLIHTADLTDLIEEIKPSLSSKILKSLDEKTRKQIKLIMNYEDDVVGSYMHLNFIYLNENMTVSQAIKKIKNEDQGENENYEYYIVNSDHQLEGVITLKELFFSSSKEKIMNICEKNLIYLKSSNDKEQAYKLFQKYQISQIPVLNSRNKLVGVLDYDDILGIIEEETTEDFEKSAGITQSQHHKEYLEKSTREMSGSRIKWLVLLMISATLSQIALQGFQGIFSNSHTLNKIVPFLNDSIFTAILIPILPVISGTAGNAGSQSSTVIIRSMALGEISRKDYWKIIRKEWVTSLVVGSLLVIANFLRMFVYFLILYHSKNYSGNGFLGIGNFAWYSMISTSLSLLFIVMIVKIVGASLPILAIKFKTDPAVMAAPLLTTLTDAISTTIFFGMSFLVFWLFLR